MKIVSKISIILCAITIASINIINVLFYNSLSPFLFIYTTPLYLFCIVCLVFIGLGKRYTALTVLTIVLFFSPIFGFLIGNMNSGAVFYNNRDDMEVIALEIIEENKDIPLKGDAGFITIELPEQYRKYSNNSDDVHFLYTTEGNYAVSFRESSGILSGNFRIYFLNPPSESDFENSYFYGDNYVLNSITENWYYYMSD
ncbi:MAG: hypothetical protein AB1Z23_10985 [Eubacteriales bacterium]